MKWSESLSARVDCARGGTHQSVEYILQLLFFFEAGRMHTEDCMKKNLSMLSVSKSLSLLQYNTHADFSERYVAKFSVLFGYFKRWFCEASIYDQAQCTAPPWPLLSAGGQ